MPRLVFEIGTEELPARFAQEAVAQLQDLAPRRLADLLVPGSAVKVYGTLRRLVLVLEDIPTAFEAERRGPPAERAFAPDGTPTKAAEGFARSCGVAVTALARRTTEEGEYVFARYSEQTSAFLARELHGTATSLRFPKMMRWGGPPAEQEDLKSFQFGRPIRWLLCLLDDEVIPVRIRDLEAGRRTRAHPNARKPWVEVSLAAQYEAVLKKAQVVVDPALRRRRLLAQLRKLARSVGGAVHDPGAALLEQTVLSLEFPTAYLGRFDESFLQLPRAVLEAAMVKAQEFFPVAGSDGNLLPHFIGVRDGGRAGLDTVRTNAEWVLRAKLIDAKFFYDRDLQHDLQHFVERTRGIVFLKDRRSLYEKQERLARILTEWDWLPEGVRLTAIEAARVCKFDRATQLVAEYPGLQGVLGGEYLRRWQHDPAVADAVAYHYDPPSPSDGEPTAAVVLALADKLDTLVNAFAAGLEPTGSADPYGLRREATAITAALSMLRSAPSLLDTRLLDGVIALNGLSIESPERKSVRDFIAERLRFFVRTPQPEGHGLSHDLAEAVLRADANDPQHAESLPGANSPARAVARAQAILKLRKQKSFKAVADAATRSANILPKETPPGGLAGRSFKAREAQTLRDAINGLTGQLSDEVREMDFERVYALLRDELTPRVHSFFEEVLVIDKNDPAGTADRLILVRHAFRCFTRLCDFSVLEL